MVIWWFPGNSLMYGQMKRMPRLAVLLFSLTGWTTLPATTLPSGRVSTSSLITVNLVRWPLNSIKKAVDNAI